MRIMRITMLVAALGFVSASASPALGQDTTGFNLGLGLNGSSVELDDDDLGNGDGSSDSGAGFYVNAGYNFTPNIGLFVSGAGATVSGDDDDEYGLGNFDIGGRYTFANAARALAPYVELAFTGMAAVDELDTGEDLELSGTGVTGAAGLNYFFTPKLAADVQFRYTSGEFTTIKLGNQSVSDEDGIGVNIGRFNLGLAWFP